MLVVFYRIILLQALVLALIFYIISYSALYMMRPSKPVFLENEPRTQQNYSYYLLAVQKWCSDEYQIHGLWPQYSHNEWPHNCEYVKYKSPNGKLLDDMNKYWSSCDDNNKLWEHEWIKHGSCVEKQFGLGENGYFTMALDLFRANPNLLTHCKVENCVLGCFDLNGKLIKCP